MINKYTLKSNNEMDINAEIIALKNKYNLIEYSQAFYGGFYSKENENKKRIIVYKWYCNSTCSHKEIYCYLIEK